MSKNMTEILRDLVNIPSPTGYSREIREFLTKYLDELKVEYTVTNKGAVIAKIPGKKEEAIMYSAHVDTLGAMVKEIKGNGRLKLSMLGGYTWTTLDAENCIVRTMDDKRYSGTFQGTKPSVHIDGQDAHGLVRNQDTTEVVLDERVSSKEDVEKLGINVGDFVFVDPRFVRTESGFIKSRYLDDKASVAILLKAIEILKEKELNNTLYFFISTYEEIGHGAAASIPSTVKEFIAVDMGAPGNGQNGSEFETNICAKDSSGPYTLEIIEKFVAICKEKNIPHKIDIYNFYGSDASAALRAGFDINVGLIGAGVFASHAYERTHEDSLKATLDLVVAYAEKGL